MRGPLGRPAVFKAGRAPRLSRWARHYYDERPPKTPQAKLARVAHWEGSRAGKFRKYRAATCARWPSWCAPVASAVCGPCSCSCR